MEDPLNPPEWNAANRESVLADYQNHPADLILIGGGITGAGIALDAVLRGLRVLLLEQNDFAEGTSSRSTKLIHGGLRYLKQGDFNLVRTVGRERARLFRNAPHLVYPEPMLLPIYKNGSLGKFTLRLALSLYEWLAGVNRREAYQMWDAQKCREAEPHLQSAGLLGGALYREYRTDDARLVITVLKTAVRNGAAALNYVKAESLCIENGKVVGVECLDRLNGVRYRLRSRVVVNAAGPWVDELRAQSGESLEKHLVLSRGLHLVVDRKKAPIRHAVYFDTSDKRMIFAIPRSNRVYVGTTDHMQEGQPNAPAYTVEEAQYLLEQLNRMFPSFQLNAHDILSAWSGLRPLIHQKGKTTSEISRKDAYFESESGLISIAGGKLTGYRVMAEQVMKIVMKRFPEKPDPGCKTANFPLCGWESGAGEAQALFCELRLGEAKQVGISMNTMQQWVQRYGSESAVITEIAYALWPEMEDKTAVGRRAEWEYCRRYESAVLPGDFWIRRTGCIWFEWPEIRDEIELHMDAFRAKAVVSDATFREGVYALYAEIDRMESVKSRG